MRVPIPSFRSRVILTDGMNRDTPTLRLAAVFHNLPQLFFGTIRLLLRELEQIVKILADLSNQILFATPVTAADSGRHPVRQSYRILRMNRAFAAARTDRCDFQSQTISCRVSHFFKQYVIVIAAQQGLCQGFQLVFSVRDNLHDRRFRHQHMPWCFRIGRDCQSLQARVFFFLPDLQKSRLAAAHRSAD